MESGSSDTYKATLLSKDYCGMCSSRNPQSLICLLPYCMCTLTTKEKIFSYLPSTAVNVCLFIDVIICSLLDEDI